MVKVDSQARGSSESSTAGSRQCSKSPPKATGPPSPRWMKKGCLRGRPLASRAVGDTCHSNHPSAGTRHRRRKAARAKAPLPRTVSARALIIRSPVVGVFDHEGTSPQVSSRSCRTGSADGDGVGVGVGVGDGD